MNCKPGDLAVMVRSQFTENVGALFEVVSSYRCTNGEWYCKAATSCVVQVSSEPKRRLTPGTPVWADDCDLRPVRDPGEDATDETLLWLPAPSLPVKEQA